ncbi:MAG: T9SS type A sorting domain-containing protein [Calditrichia bacterium]
MDDDAAPLEGFRLQQNYPNPFNPETTIEFTMASAGRVTLEIFDVLGRKVRTLVSDFLPSGSYSQRWNGRNDVGDLVESGVYVYRLQAGNFSRIRKMQLIQ